MRLLLLVILVLGASYALSYTRSYSVTYPKEYPKTPDKTKTPGDYCSSINPDFKEYRYEEKIPVCERNVTTETKTKIYNSYDIPKEDRKNYTIDHLIPLSMGGSNSNKNLWPQNKEITTAPYEHEVYTRLKNGDITRNEAVSLILKRKFNE
jgi:hypothetical protein